MLFRSKKISKEALIVSEKSDTVFLKDRKIIFISPNDKHIKNLKRKYGDNFYTIADDANNYFSEASTYLDSLKIPYKSYSDDQLIGFKTNNIFTEIKYKTPWYVIFYQNGKYKTLDLVGFKEQYLKFFKDGNYIISKKIIDSIAGDKYFIVEEKDCDLNYDTFKDKIVVFGNNNDINPQNPDTRIAPILILLNERNEKYKILINENIYPNNFGDAFKRLVVKNQFFTIELSNEVPDKYISEKYITFKYDFNNVILHRYSEMINWSSDKTNKMNYSSKDFGIIKFSDFNSNTVLETINN